MKNIHILQTPNPSRLSDCHNDKLHLDDVRYLRSYQNIYITSNDKFIKDEYVTDGLEVMKATPKLVDAQGLVNRRNWMKVVLTTDLDLIKDGVQSIPDEFLEWFFKNRNCERVEVKRILKEVILRSCAYSVFYDIIYPRVISRCCGRCNGFDDICYADMCCIDHQKYGCVECYGPVIRYEYDNKQDRTCNNNCSVLCGECQIFELTQETLEEAAERLCPNSSWKLGFIEGAKWKEKQSDDMEMIYLIQFLSMNKEFNGYGSVSKETAKFFLRRYKESK